MNNIRVNNRLERTAEVTSSAPKADAKSSEENIHDKGRKVVARLKSELLDGPYRIEANINGATVRGADIEIRYLELDLQVDAEVKQGKTGTSQVRPYEYVPLVVWGKNTEKWYVFSPNAITDKAEHLAGMHNPNPFINCNLGAPGSTPTKGDTQFWSNAECRPEDLSKAILDAYLEGEQHPEEEKKVKRYWKQAKLAADENRQDYGKP
tara:strand:- start:247 stop:870 length:624 start_codon:yes stop_codon:yes gene_type:complete